MSKIIDITSRRRTVRNNKFDNITNFFKKHQKTFIILVTAIVAILAIEIVSHLNKEQNPLGVTGIARIDGYKFGVFENEDDAIKHTIENLPAGIKKIEISSNEENVDVYTSLFTSLVTKSTNNKFLLDLTNVANNETIIVTICIGGDGSLISKCLSEDVKKYYFAVSVRETIKK